MVLSSVHQRFIRSAAALGVAVLVSAGCAGPARRPLSEAARHGLKATTIARIEQDAILVTVDPSRVGLYTGGGLIGGAIDAAVTQKRLEEASRLAAPIQDVLAKRDPRGVLRDALARELAPLKWLDGQVEARAVGTDDVGVRFTVSRSPADVLLVTARYALTPLFEDLTVDADVALLPRKLPASGEPKDHALYRNAFRVTIPMPGSLRSEDLARQAATWCAEDGRLAREAIEGAMAELARMIAFDVGEGAPKGGKYAAPAGAVRRAILNRDSRVAPLRGYVARSQDGRSWVRVESGELHSVETIGRVAPPPVPPAAPVPAVASEPSAAPVPAVADHPTP